MESLYKAESMAEKKTKYWKIFWEKHYKGNGAKKLNKNFKLVPLKNLTPLRLQYNFVNI